MAYAGETRSRALRARLVAQGVGVLVVRGRVEKAAINAWPFWCYDNGAFVDWRAGRPFDDAAFRSDVLAMLDLPAERRPDFAVLPDVVAGGAESLATSLSWLARIGRLGIRWALAVQDGMTPDAIPWDAPFDVVFVGGTLGWKMATSAAWARAAHEHGRACHVGRVGTARRVRWAFDAEVDSIDSALPLWSEGNCAQFLGALERGRRQMSIEWEVARG